MDDSTTIGITVNGEQRRVPPALSLPGVLAHLGYTPELVVVELNGTIRSRSSWSGCVVGESDVLEVVTIVGGGS